MIFMGARLQTTPQALWLVQPIPSQQIIDGIPNFHEGIRVGEFVDEVGWTNVFLAQGTDNFIRCQGVKIERGTTSTEAFQADLVGNLYTKGQFVAMDAALDEFPGITTDVVVGAQTLHFKFGILIGIT